MRFILPVALLGASVVMAESAEDLINSMVPDCLRSCAKDSFESATSCSIDDTDCICSSNVGADTFSSMMSDMTDCAMNADCDASDLESASDINLDEVESKAANLCGGSSGGSDSSDDASSDSSDDTSSDSGDDASSDNANDSTGEDGAMALSGTTAILAAGAMMVVAAL
ncbi:CFEM domain-containing protein [Aspergillus lucknowensis]|uniref:CFEM domain-containing protein n=1 Tax=Aspergillus lucknowensis TaxID=176173 RepID=A0ABR4LS37_9EURO